MSYRDRDRDYYGGGGGGGRREWQRDRPARVSLVVRNLPIDTRPDELRVKFERYGQRPRGFAFVEYRDALDAEDAVYQLDRTMYGGREITVAYSKESRKTPFEMLSREQRLGGTVVETATIVIDTGAVAGALIAADKAGAGAGVAPQIVGGSGATVQQSGTPAAAAAAGAGAGVLAEVLIVQGKLSTGAP
eukprot:gene18796-25341_t